MGLNEDDDKKAKSGLMRRWFRGGEAAIAPADAPPPPAASEAEPPAEAPAPVSVAAALLQRRS